MSLGAECDAIVAEFEDLARRRRRKRRLRLVTERLDSMAEEQAQLWAMMVSLESTKRMLEEARQHARSALRRR